MTVAHIVLAAHGSRHPDGLAALEAFAGAVSARHPLAEVRLARTMGEAHRRQNGRPPRAEVSLPAVLAELEAGGARRVVVQSLHVAPGAEYHEILAGIAAFGQGGGRIGAISVGGPLLSEGADLDRVAGAVLAEAPAGRRAGEALALMGHGAGAPGDALYAALGERLSRLDPGVLLGTLSPRRGQPSPDPARLAGEFSRRGVGTVWLMPFLTVAGAHAHHDLAGDGPHSWKSVFTAAGLRCHADLRGLIERPSLAAIWLDHLDRAMARLS